MTLLVNMAGWQLPEWLTLGSSAGVISALIAMYANFKKLSSIKEEQKLSSLEQISLLTNLVNIIAANADKDKQISEVLESQRATLERLEHFEESINNRVTSFAVYMDSAFQKSSLSDLDKLELTLKRDELFGQKNLELVTELQKGNEELTTLLSVKTIEADSLKAELEAIKTKAARQDTPARKGRRV